jgi:hypothetical protein
VTLFLVRSPFILSPTILIALSSSASGSVSPSFFFRKFVRKRATSFLSAKDTSDESLFWSAMPHYRTIPVTIVGSAFGAYFRTSATQSSEMAFLPIEFSRKPCLQTLPIRGESK